MSGNPGPDPTLDVRTHAGLLRQLVEHRSVPAPVHAALSRTRPDRSLLAHTYAFLVADGEVRVAEAVNDRKASGRLRRVRQRLEEQLREAEFEFEWFLESGTGWAGTGGSRRHALITAVLRVLGGPELEARIDAAATPNIPTEDAAPPLESSDADSQGSPPDPAGETEVRRLLGLPDNDFVVAARDMIATAQPPAVLRDPMVLARVTELSGTIEAGFRQVRSKALAMLAKMPTSTPLREVAVRSCRESADASVNLLELRLLPQINERAQRISERRETARVWDLIMQFARSTPGLLEIVELECEAHRAGCSVRHDARSRHDCALTVAASARARVDRAASRPARDAVTPAPPAATRDTATLPPSAKPTDTAAAQFSTAGQPPARWVSGEGGTTGDRIEWQATLRRSDIASASCPLPGGSLWAASHPTRLRLRHTDADGRPTATQHRVRATRADTGWQLQDIKWPATFSPGVIVTFVWVVGEPAAVAHVRLAAAPEQVNGQLYMYDYDPRVAVRESAGQFDLELNNADTDRSDRAWVLRTLRQLGHLAPDGTAIMAVDALIHNCRWAGYARASADTLLAAVEGLHREGVLHKVDGSTNTHGLPSYPPREGETPTPLLLYAPDRRPVAPSPGGTAPAGALGTHAVAGHVRRLPAGQRRSDDATARHEAAVRAARMVERQLRDDQTFVQAHARSGRRRRTPNN